jgi:hypothetical protein
MSVHYEPRGGQLGCMSRSIVLLKRYKPDGDAPRDLPGYDGKGASKALWLATARAYAAADVSMRDRSSIRGLELLDRAKRLQKMFVSIERDERHESEAV